METFSRCLPSSPPLKYLSKTLKSLPNSHVSFSNYFPISTSKLLSFNSTPTAETQTPNTRNNTASRNRLIPIDLCFLNSHHFFNKNHLPLLFLGFPFPLSCSASETADLPTEVVSDKISLESILVSIDNFFNRYPFFVATVVFIWLVAIPLTEEYLQKYKYISAINAFKKLREDPNCQLLDIRESRSLAALDSPNLKILNKSAVQLEFQEGDEEGFVKRVLENLGDPADTAVCIVDNFDGNSLKVAELLVKNGGFKEAYAIRGGLRGKKGWQEIQVALLPPSVHVYPKKKAKKLKHFDKNVGKSLEDSNDNPSTYNTNKTTKEKSSSVSPGAQSKGSQRPLSPYPNYPDLRPPSSPTPSKPK